MRKILIVVISIALLSFALSFAKDAMAKLTVEKVVQAATGLGLDIGSLRVSLIKSFVGIENLQLFNPRGYTDQVMLDVPEIYLDYNLAAILQGKLHLTEARINLREFVVAKNEQGQLNLDALKIVQQPKTNTAAQTGKRTKTRIPPLQIDSLELKIGKVIYKDYSKSEQPKVREFNLNLNERYHNVKDAYSLVTLIVVKALLNTTIAKITDFDLNALQSTVSATMDTAEQMLIQTVQQVQKVATQAREGAQQAAEQTVETLKRTTDKLQNTFKLFAD